MTFRQSYYIVPPFRQSYCIFFFYPVQKKTCTTLYIHLFIGRKRILCQQSNQGARVQSLVTTLAKRRKYMKLDTSDYLFLVMYDSSVIMSAKTVAKMENTFWCCPKVLPLSQPVVANFSLFLPRNFPRLCHIYYN